MALTTKTARLMRNGLVQLTFRNAGAATDEELVAAPAAANQIVVTSLLLDSDGVSTFQDDADAEYLTLGAGQYGWRGNLRSPLFEMAKGEPLEINSDGAFSGILQYRIV